MSGRALRIALLLGVTASPALAAGDPDTAALQVALRARAFYGGTIDGMNGPMTAAAVTAFQARAGLVVDGVAGPQTRDALDARPLGSRPLLEGAMGWDVAALQFALAWRGFPSRGLDGIFGERTEKALRRFQRHERLAPDGVAGPATYAALERPPPAPPLALQWPLSAPLESPFGPRGARFHSGIDLAAPAGTPVAAAAAGRVAYARELAGGWGLVVTIAHGPARTMYAHLSATDVAVGDRVAAGSTIGRVGASGTADGPHLHFELRVRGAAVDPLPALRP